MKIYKKRKLNAMYLLHNLQRVGDLKEGMEIMVSTEDEVYFVETERKNKFREDYPIDNLVPLIRDYVSFGMESDAINKILFLDNIIGNNILQFKVINDVKCLVMTLTEYMVKNLKEMYSEDSYIVFDNLSLTNIASGGFYENTRVDVINKTIAILPQPAKMHTEDELNNFYQLVADKVLEKEEVVKRLLDGEEIPTENGRIWTKNGFEKELQILSELTPLLIACEDKVLTIKTFFDNMNETPINIFKLLGIYLDSLENAMITRTFS